MTQASPNAAPKKAVSPSMLNMLSAIIVIIHADGVVHEKELEFFNRIVDGIGSAYDLMPAHRKMLEAELASPKTLDAVLPHITDPEYKSLLFYFGQILAWSDGGLPAAETALLNKIHAELTGFDTAETMAQIRQDMAEELQRRKAQPATMNPLLYALNSLLKHMGIE